MNEQQQWTQEQHKQWLGTYKEIILRHFDLENPVATYVDTAKTSINLWNNIEQFDAEEAKTKWWFAWSFYSIAFPH